MAESEQFSTIISDYNGSHILTVEAMDYADQRFVGWKHFHEITHLISDCGPFVPLVTDLLP
jgi:hypothetical protein